MPWLWRKRIGAFFRGSLWVFAVISMFLAMVCAPLTRRLDAILGLPLLGFGLQGARGAAALVAAAMLTFVVFFFSVLLLSVQIASGNLSPRIIARSFQSSPLKLSLSLFVFTFVYSVSVLGRLEEQVLQLSLFLTLSLTLVSIGVFLFIVEHIGKRLRPVTVVTKVAQEGLAVIRDMYPGRWTSSSTYPSKIAAVLKENVPRLVTHNSGAGVIIAFDLKGLVELAERNDCTIELVPQVGDFVGVDSHLFRVYGAANEIRDDELRNSVVVGAERTMEQDPAFAFRIIVDIAARALSPAINDPTTGVLAIDQLQTLLQEVGTRDLNTGIVCDQSGRVRLIYGTLDWEAFVLLAVAEIRQYGANSLQIMRRLRAMLEELIRVLPRERASFLELQLELIHASVEREFSDPPDRVQAEIPDSQGLGGKLPHSSFLVPHGH